MSIAWVMLFGGFILAVAGWKNIAFLEALRGNFNVPKASTSGGSTSASTGGGPTAAGGG